MEFNFIESQRGDPRAAWEQRNNRYTEETSIQITGKVLSIEAWRMLPKLHSRVEIPLGDRTWLVSATVNATQYSNIISQPFVRSIEISSSAIGPTGSRP